ncbi:hypothetical protein CBR_g29615 [Chara braunii]|uniref:Uncharacterized protein n=1 Tax=Chara braunii TaxID=69332 RepID=A0A388LAY0_CHABU|nr:hypothetical protein CBR_g29615 [Chara braunii]|eukprot:GBG79469.1 hypothetical protein CBR_g29615 [Chara braunii]
MASSVSEAESADGDDGKLQPGTLTNAMLRKHRRWKQWSKAKVSYGRSQMSTYARHEMWLNSLPPGYLEECVMMVREANMCAESLGLSMRYNLQLLKDGLWVKVMEKPTPADKKSNEFLRFRTSWERKQHQARRRGLLAFGVEDKTNQPDESLLLMKQRRRMLSLEIFSHTHVRLKRLAMESKFRAVMIDEYGAGPRLPYTPRWTKRMVGLRRFHRAGQETVTNSITDVEKLRRQTKLTGRAAWSLPTTHAVEDSAPLPKKVQRQQIRMRRLTRGQPSMKGARTTRALLQEELVDEESPTPVYDPRDMIRITHELIITGSVPDELLGLGAKATTADSKGPISRLAASWGLAPNGNHKSGKGQGHPKSSLSNSENSPVPFPGRNSGYYSVNETSSALLSPHNTPRHISKSQLASVEDSLVQAFSVHTRIGEVKPDVVEDSFRWRLRNIHPLQPESDQGHSRRFRQYLRQGGSLIGSTTAVQMATTSALIPRVKEENGRSNAEETRAQISVRMWLEVSSGKWTMGSKTAIQMATTSALIPRVEEENGCSNEETRAQTSVRMWLEASFGKRGDSMLRKCQLCGSQGHDIHPSIHPSYD